MNGTVLVGIVPFLVASDVRFIDGENIIQYYVNLRKVPLTLLKNGLHYLDKEELLNDAARTGIYLSKIRPLPGGFSGRCAAWRYRRLAALARRNRVRLQVQRRRGLFFCPRN